MGNGYKRQREKFLHKLLELQDGTWNYKKKNNALKLQMELNLSKYKFTSIKKI